MGVCADEIAAYGDEDHDMRDVDAPLIIAHEEPPARHPVEGALGSLRCSRSISPISPDNPLLPGAP